VEKKKKRMPDTAATMRIYHNPRCSKSREALKLIQDKGVRPEIIEYLVTTPTESELKEVIDQIGISPEELVRKGEEDYKANFKGKQLTDSEWISALVKFPKLIERPIVVNGTLAVIGRPPEKVLELL
jgi:arsenate reductase (glutaredoxin)